MGEAVVEVGSTANNYKILARLATGGMAEIFLARGVSATGVERYCVLKRILRNRANDAAFVRMFLDEARLAAQLQHPHIAQVYDIGKLGDSYFFTMEYVHGETVRAILQRARSLRRDLPLASLLTIVAGAAAGLHHAHDRIGIDGRPLHIVHRDVSPSNLMVSYEGTVKVVDFGVAKASDRANETRSGTVKGKISYLSPEQARGTSAIDRRSDLFSLGIVMWEMLTTERLYKRASDFENMSAIVNEPAPPPSSRKPHIPAELDAITLKLLAKSPDERFQSADELVEALEDFASRHATMISASSLSRFLRDMFGQRPEPWVEMDTLEAAGDVPLTVTSEPIPSGLAIPLDGNIDLQLDSVPSLAPVDPVPQIEPSLPTPFLGRPEDLPTLPHPRVAAATTQLGPAVAVTKASGPQLRIPSSGPRLFVPPSAPVPEPKPGVGWQLVSIIMIAAIVGSLTMWMVMRNHGGSAPPIDAGLVVPAPVAAPIVAPPPADAAELVAAVEVDAAPPPEPAPAVEPPVAEMKAVPAAPRKSAFEVAWDAASYRQLVALCQRQFPPASDDVRCVVAACKLHQESKARAFFAKLSPTSKARKAAIITACSNADTAIQLEPEPRNEEKSACESDPMSCQH